VPAPPCATVTKSSSPRSGAEGLQLGSPAAHRPSASDLAASPLDHLDAMKLLPTLAAALALTLPAAAQLPCGGVPGVTATATPAMALPGEPIVVQLTNNSNQTITLPTSCTFGGVQNGSDCTGTFALGLFCLTVLVPIPPGQSSVQVWDQTDGAGNFVPVGDYSIPIQYFDGNFVSVSCCLPVTIQDDPGLPFCFGSGCPCGNDGSGGGGCANSAGTGAVLDAVGNADVAQDTVVLTATGAPAGVPGLFFSGPTAQMGTLFGDGLRCAGGQLTRLGVVITDGSGDASSQGSLSVQEGLIGGESRSYQFWYRDVTGPCGMGFNLTNGYVVQW